MAEKIYYFDNNATTPVREEARLAMHPYESELFGNPSGIHSVSQKARHGLEEARERCAAVLGCKPQELIFTAGGTESINLALRGTALANAAKSSKKNNLLHSSVEHAAVRETAAALKVLGVEANIVPVYSDGSLDMEEFNKFLTEEVFAVALMYANNETGVIQPVKEVSELCRSFTIPVIVDGVQAVGKLPLKVSDIGCDLLAFSGHKFEGPKGTGLLYIREGTPWTTSATGGTQEMNRRGGTQNVAGAVGLSIALQAADRERETYVKQVGDFRDLWEQLLLELIPDTLIHGRQVDRVANTSFMSFPGAQGESLVAAMDLEGICASTGPACSEGSGKTSNTLHSMGVPADLIEGAVRFSFGRSTTDEDIRAAAQIVFSLVERNRG